LFSAPSGLGALGLIVMLLVRSRRQEHEVANLNDQLARTDRAFSELSGEVNRLRDRVRLVEKATLPAWLFVAIAHHQDRGGMVVPEAAGLRFADRAGVEIYTVHLPVRADDEEIVAQDLHQRLGISQRQYLETVLRHEHESSMTP
jgi:hypothetical protein